MQECVTKCFGHLPKARFAVRSSAIGEDGTEFSSAGQMETFLEVPPEEVGFSE